MAGFAFLAFYLAGGWFAARCLLPGKPLPVRAWLGLALGTFLMMWLPAALAFLRPFDAATQWLSLALLLLLCGVSWFFRSRVPVNTAIDRKTWLLLALTVLPLTLLMAYLQHTHVLQPENGALHTGQATYGDLPLHLSIAASLPGKTFPADYSILPGARLGYPFLGDSLSASFVALGWGLRESIIVPGTLMSLLAFLGYALLARRICASKKAALLAFLLVFINGGLGFLYSFDMAGVSLGYPGGNELQAGTWADRLATILGGWYQTPVNHAEFETYNLRWSNIVADMLLPQRTFLAGWAMLMPCLYLLLDNVKSGKWDTRRTILLGVLAGGLPLIHTHSFLALGLASAGFMAYGLFKKEEFTPWLLYGAVAAALALPQLLAFTFGQAGDGGFLKFQFNWVNNSGGQGLRDGYVWFYVKNVGLPFVLLLFALPEKNAGHRRLFAGAFAIFAVAELVLFQPNEYDNNKLFYVWWALCAMPAADFAFTLYAKLRGVRARPLMAAAALFLTFTGGSLSIAREAVSDYRMFSPEDAAVSEYVRENTPPHAVFVTAQQHLNPVSSLAGRDIVCGPSLWLHWHGFDTGERQAAIRAFYLEPGANAGIIRGYGAQYVLLGPYEREMGGDAGTLGTLFPLLYENEQYAVYGLAEE